MNVTQLSSASPGLPPVGSASDDALRTAKSGPPDKTKIAEASRQFEAVLVRQFLSESMKSLTDNGASGQVYGYYLNDTLSNSITKGGGLGLASVFQAQIAGTKGAK